MSLNTEETMSEDSEHDESGLSDTVEAHISDPASVGEVKHKLKLANIKLKRKNLSYDNLKFNFEISRSDLIEKIETFDAQLKIAEARYKAALETIKIDSEQQNSLFDELTELKLKNEELMKIKIDVEVLATFLNQMLVLNINVPSSYVCNITGLNAMDFITMKSQLNLPIDDLTKLTIFELNYKFQSKILELGGNRESLNAFSQTDLILDEINRITSQDVKISSHNTNYFELTLLREDKQHLTNQISCFETEISNLLRNIDTLTKKNSFLDSENHKIKQELVELERSLIKDYEVKLGDQVRALSKVSDEEARRLKLITDEMHLREINLLRNQLASQSVAKDSLEVKVRSLESSLTRSQEEYRSLLNEYSEKLSKFVLKPTESRPLSESNTLKLKLDLDIMESKLKESEADSQCLKAKLAKTVELYKELETRTRNEKRDYELKLQTMESKLLQYECIEAEIDTAIEAHGKHAKPLIPTLNKRRLEHSVKLSEELLMTRNKLSTIEQSKKILEVELEKYRHELARAESLITYNDQSPNVLAKALADRETVLTVLKKETQQLENQLKKEKCSKKKVIAERNELAKDMKLLLKFSRNNLQ